MARFNPDDYEDVATRLKRFKKDWPESRIVTRLLSSDGEVRATRWVVQAEIYLDREIRFPDATGLAAEIDGSGGANNTAALENGETSAIGRALANLGYHGDLRASREEMAKVQREEARQEDLKAWADKCLALEKAGELDKLKANMQWAGKKGDRDKFHIAQGIVQRLEAATTEPQSVGDVMDAEVIEDGPAA